MAYPLDQEIEILLLTGFSCSYIISSHHRGHGPRQKSRWTVSRKAEVDCFEESMNNLWVSENSAWGILVINGTFQILGRNSRQQALKFAKFVDSKANDTWHGYPADYLNKAQDRPATNILKAWVLDGRVSKSHMKKIRSGQPCNL